MEMAPLRPHSEGGVRVLPEAGAEPMAPELRIRTLWTPQVWLGEVPLTFRRRKSLALLVYLALTRRAHGRDALASLFVDRASDAQAREQFRTTLQGLVEQVGAFVLVTRETIALDRAQPWWLDADELQAAILLIERATQFVDDKRRARFLDNLPAHRTLLHAWRDYSRWATGAEEQDADASVPPRAFDSRRPTPLHIVRREESS